MRAMISDRAERAQALEDVWADAGGRFTTQAIDCLTLAEARAILEMAEPKRDSARAINYPTLAMLNRASHYRPSIAPRLHAALTEALTRFIESPIGEQESR